MNNLSRMLVIMILLLVSTNSVLGYGLISTQDNVTMSSPIYNITLVPILNFTSMSSDGTTLTMEINSSILKLNSSQDFILSNVSSNGKMLFNVDAIGGNLNISSKMTSVNTNYNLKVDNIVNQIRTSNATGWLNFNYSGTWSSHDFEISLAPITVLQQISISNVVSISKIVASVYYNQTITQVCTISDSVSINKIVAPIDYNRNISQIFTITDSVSVTKTILSIIIILNNKTGDSSTNFNIYGFNSTLFTVVANQTITTWTWGVATKIGGDGTTSSTASKMFINNGTEYITVYGTNSNGSTQTITWTVNVLYVPMGFTLSSISESPLKIFKCQPSTIVASFTGVDITSVNAILTSEKAVQSMVPGSGEIIPRMESTTIPMSWNGTHWIGTFGNDQNLLWGNRFISFSVTNASGTDIVGSSGAIFVYSDKCTGTGVSNYTQVGNGLGRYTRMLYNGQFNFFGSSFETSFIGWAIFPYIELFGYLFYLLVIFVICTTIYLKTQNVVQPLVIAILLLLLLSTTSAIDVVYRKWIIVILALGITALYYRVFVKE